MTVKPWPPSGLGKPIATRSDGSADMTSDPTTETTNRFFRALEHHPMIMSGLIAAALGIMTGLGVFFLMFLGARLARPLLERTAPFELPVGTQCCNCLAAAHGKRPQGRPPGESQRCL